MNKNILFSALVVVLFLISNPLQAQNPTIDQAFKTETVEQLGELINARYVFPDVAKKTSEYLQTQLKSGAFDQYTDVKSFAAALTTAVQSVNKDKHMRIRPAPGGMKAAETPESMVDDKLDQMAWQRGNAAGFREARRLESNIGYLDLRGFSPVEAGAPMADRYMGLLAGSDAIIIDLRKNGGGSPEMVQYLCSFFFNTPVHLNSLYWREGDQTKEFWTIDKVGGDKMPDVPLFILTSSYTFSGAEEFSYNMQTRKRATLVGETTGGGANPGGMFPINDKLGVFIPTGTAINPVTKTNWEGTGVEPEVKTTAEEALNKALELARAAADEYRQKTREKYRVHLTALMAQLKIPDVSEENLFDVVQQCTNAGLLTEDDINGLGYEYLLMHQQPATAELIFKCNTRLYPGSANVYDSYGEALLANGKKEEAVKSYQKAVEVAVANQHPNIEMFQTNLKTAMNSPVKRP